MQFVTEPWQPLRSLKVRLDQAPANMPTSRSYEIRHWLALIGVALLMLSPVAGVVSGIWAYASLAASVAILMVCTAIILVPGEQAELDEYESSKDRRDT